MAHSILIFTSVLLALSTSIVSSPIEQRILGGQIARENQFPHFVSFRILDLVIPHFCSGTIINTNFILTTAICVNNRTDISRITLVVGTMRMQDVGQRHRIAAVMRHPQFTGDNMDWLSHNIAMVQTQSPIEYNERVQPARMFLQELESQHSVIMAGWQEVQKNYILFIYLHLVIFVFFIPISSAMRPTAFAV